MVANTLHPTTTICSSLGTFFDRCSIQPSYAITILRIITFWPKFYWCLFKPKPDRQSIWNILTNPEPLEGIKTKNVSNRMICLKDTYYCHSYYQVHGAYAHLNQRRENDLDEAVIEANTVMYYDDPLRISTPYEYLAKRLPRPPDGHVKAALSLGLIVLIYLIPILKGLITLWMRLIAAHLFKNDARNIFIRHVRRRRKKGYMRHMYTSKCTQLKRSQMRMLSPGIPMAYHGLLIIQPQVSSATLDSCLLAP